MQSIHILPLGPSRWHTLIKLIIICLFLTWIHRLLPSDLTRHRHPLILKFYRIKERTPFLEIAIVISTLIVVPLIDIVKLKLGKIVTRSIVSLIDFDSPLNLIRIVTALPLAVQSIDVSIRSWIRISSGFERFDQWIGGGLLIIMIKTLKTDNGCNSGLSIVGATDGHRNIGRLWLVHEQHLLALPLLPTPISLAAAQRLPVSGAIRR